ncbi:hypothetical protein AV530_012042 [Patagioenas fasciata monilis]|uniref:Uncharacterized protein n=1 Tax=Patagioenas fasciata monilis TaxID=372326 RepID=A0A1V4JV22_PATFA|nr:hypothetical protein AV530_012042 [Patagioenas fasciata monilis]
MTFSKSLSCTTSKIQSKGDNVMKMIRKMGSAYFKLSIVSTRPRYRNSRHLYFLSVTQKIPVVSPNAITVIITKDVGCLI